MRLGNNDRIYCVEGDITCQHIQVKCLQFHSVMPGLYVIKKCGCILGKASFLWGVDGPICTSGDKSPQKVVQLMCVNSSSGLSCFML